MRRRHKTMCTLTMLISFFVIVMVITFYVGRTHGRNSSFLNEKPANVRTVSLPLPCSTVHVAMVATNSTEGIVLYNTLKSVFMHRSTPLHFHFIIDNYTHTILHTMLDSWLLPGVTQDYYTMDDEMSNKINFNASCENIVSLLLSLEEVVDDDVNMLIAIEPTSVVTVDLALLRFTSEFHEDNPILLCGSSCVTYCSGTAEPQPVGWGAMAVKLNSKKHWKGKVCSSFIQKMEWNITQASKHTCDMVRRFDGERLRYIEDSRCPENMKPIMTPAPPKCNKCALFEWERNVKRRVVPHILGHSYTARDKHDVSLSLQLSFTRLSFLGRILSYWDGPASVAIYVTDSELESVFDYLKNNSLYNRLNVTYHLVFNIGNRFPINVVRAVSHRFVQTPYFLFMDVDFVPQPGLYQKIKEKLRNQEFGNTTKTAIVIPSFETLSNKSKVPTTKSEMVKMFDRKKFIQFHGKSFSKAQAATDYTKWRSAKKPYYIKWKASYEPYTVLETSILTFDGQFLQRFWNKAVYFAELHMAGYKFIVANDLFVLHFPHASISHSIASYHECGKKWYKDCLKGKKKQYDYESNDVDFFNV